MYEFVRYTFLVLLGMASLVALFISFAITGAVVTGTEGRDLAENSTAIYWIWGVMAISGCLWLFGSFLCRVPFTILHWLQDHKDHITAYLVLLLITMIFISS